MRYFNFKNILKTCCGFIFLCCSIAYAYPAMIKNLTINITNSTANSWQIVNFPQTSGCVMSQDLFDIYWIGSNKTVTINATCSDLQKISVATSYSRGDSNFTLNTAVDVTTPDYISLAANAEKVHLDQSATCNKGVSCTVNVNIQSAKKTVAISLTGHFDRASAGLIAKQIANSLSPDSVFAFDVGLDGYPFSYQLMNNNTTLLLTFVIAGV